MKIALVDDDRECLMEMEKICHGFGIRAHCHMEIFTFTCGEAFLEALDRNRFSIVFMDIYMDGMDGITAALKMRETDSRCILVFLTSNMDFMPEAFSCHAFEYISKPFPSQRITDVLRDAMKILPLSEQYIELLNGRKTVRVLLDEIISVLTDAHYLDIGLRNGTVLHNRMRISEFMEQIGEDPRFIFVNRGIVLNADHIIDFENNCCITENGARFPIRVRDRMKIEQEIQEYHFNRLRDRQHKIQ